MRGRGEDSMAGSIAWRIAQRPLPDKIRVALAGAHFPACYPYTKQILQTRNLDSSIELIKAPSWKELMDLAPHIHAAIPFMERFTAEFIEAAPNLRLIQQQGVGLEGVDMATASKEGVAVCNIPSLGTANAEATAEHAILLTMMLLRGTHTNLPQRFSDRKLGGNPLPRTLLGQRVTVVGYGSVGTTLCRYLTVLGAKVTAVRKRPWSPADTRITDTAFPGTTIRQSNNLDDELPTTDVLILCCVMTPETHHLVNEERLQLLPEGSHVINVGRGPLVEYDAMLNALQNNHVAGFASDVGVGHDTKASEPWDPLDPLSTHPHTIFTPHVGGNCDIVVRNMAETIVTNLERILKGEEPYHWVNNATSPS